MVRVQKIFGVRKGAFKRGLRLGLATVTVILTCLATSSSSAATDTNSPPTPRQLYNDGTKKLREGKLQEAEVALQSALATQNEHVQPSTLYNLGEVRFQQGVEEFKKGPNQQAAHANAQHAQAAGSAALQAVDEALAGQEIDKMVSAYRRGRGARKELKAATEAVKHSLETFGNVLAKWQRASGDFKSTLELQPADADAKTNADVVDRSIAALVDQQQMMMQAMQSMMQQSKELGEKLGKLKKKIPQDGGDSPKGKGDDDEEGDEDKPSKEPNPEGQEPEHHSGQNMQLTSQEAARLLDMLKLDGNHKLPLGTSDTAKPDAHKGRDW